MKPEQTPIGLVLSHSGRLVSSAFDEALSEAGGSLPTWLILLNLTIRDLASQRELADAVGIREATLSTHLDVMEKKGLLTRRRDSSNRRVQLVELTKDGEAAFLRLRVAALQFDRRLRAGCGDAELATLRSLLGRLVANIGAEPRGAPWADLAEKE